MMGYTVVFGPGIPGVLGGREILGFIGPGEPGLRAANWQAMSRQQRNRKLRNRRRSKLARAQRRQMRKQESNP
jgi:hypothetical protein